VLKISNLCDEYLLRKCDKKIYMDRHIPTYTEVKEYTSPSFGLKV
jgi:hypothetical protein